MDAAKARARARVPPNPEASVSRRSLPFALLAVLAAGASIGAAPLAGQGIWPDRAENLQVLPADFPPDRLSAVMRGFTRALGVRCSFCHVGEEGQPLRSYDFVSDDRRNKVVARRMLEMLGDINDDLREIEPSGPDRVNMWCHTCHAGKPRPMTLEETLSEVRDAEGQEAAVGRYGDLREHFYGGNQYDFRPGSVEGAALGFLEAGDTVLAAGLLEANVENHPERADGYERLGDLALARGDREEAIRWYEATLARDPEHPRAADKLAAIRGGGDGPA